MMVAIGLDGAAGSMVFSGRSELSTKEKFDMRWYPNGGHVSQIALRGLLLCDTRPLLSLGRDRIVLSAEQRRGSTAAHLSVFECCSTRSRRCGMRLQIFRIPTRNSVTRFSRAMQNGLAPRPMCSAVFQ